MGSAAPAVLEATRKDDDRRRMIMADIIKLMQKQPDFYAMKGLIEAVLKKK